MGKAREASIPRQKTQAWHAVISAQETSLSLTRVCCPQAVLKAVAATEVIRAQAVTSGVARAETARTNAIVRAF